jgi:hypothetical protein
MLQEREDGNGTLRPLLLPRPLRQLPPWPNLRYSAVTAGLDRVWSGG